MREFGLAPAYAAVFILLLIRTCLNHLSTMAVARMAEDEDRPSHSVRAFLRRKPTYEITLQVALLLLLTYIVLCLSHMEAPFAGSALAIRFAIAAGSLLALSLLAQITASLHPEAVFRACLPFLRGLVWVLGVVTVPLSMLISKALERHRRRMEANDEDKDRDEDIAALIDVGTREGIFEEEDSALIQGVMEFGDTVVREVMTPRTDMVSAEAQSPLSLAAEILAEAGHTRLPLYEGQIDNIVGVAYVKDFLAPLQAGKGDRPIGDFARPVPFVPENKPISELLREFQERRVQLAIVVDEYGGVDGLVTTEDLVEEIVGELQEHDEVEEPPFVTVEEGVVEALGKAPVDDLSELLDVDIPEGDYDSIAGWIITELGTIPDAGASCDLSGLHVDVLEADSKRIHRVRLHRIEPADTEPA